MDTKESDIIVILDEIIANQNEIIALLKEISNSPTG